MSYANWRQGGTGCYSPRSHAYHGYGGQNNQSSSYAQNQHESYPTNRMGYHRGGYAYHGYGGQNNQSSSYAQNQHESYPTNRMGYHRGGYAYHGYSGQNNQSSSYAQNQHESYPTNRMGYHRGGYTQHRYGGQNNQNSSYVQNEHESYPTNRRGYHRGGHAHHRYGSQNNQSSSYVQNEHESYPTNRTGYHRGRSTCRGRGVNFIQRGTINYGCGKQRGVNRGHHSAQGRPRDVSSSQTSHSTSSVSKTPQHEKFLDFPFIQQQETVHLLSQFQVMFILRGLPGSGKSTLASSISEQYKDQAVVCSADYYHYNKNGEYVWKQEKLQETHNKCQKQAEKFCVCKKPLIVIDNTNVKHSEVEPYIKLAKQYGYVAVLVEPRTPWKFEVRELAKRNKHNVPVDKIYKRVEQYDEIVPLYFGWFISQPKCVELWTLAKDVLQKCLKITEFQQCIKLFSDHSYPTFTIDNALSYYSMTNSDSHNLLHVTACFSPRGKFLSGSLYHKSSTVVKALGQVSLVTIIGCVMTSETFSARVVLTNEQRELWMNYDMQEKQSKRGRATQHVQHSVDEMTSLFKRLPLEDGERGSKELQPDYSASASTHVTLGKGQGVSPVQAKYDVESVVDYELSSCVFEEYILPGDTGKIKKYSDTVWAVYFNEAHVIKLPAIFSGCYE